MLEDALEYAQQRKAFNKVIGQFQAIQHMIADMAMGANLSEIVIPLVAKNVDLIDIFDLSGAI